MSARKLKKPVKVQFRSAFEHGLFIIFYTEPITKIYGYLPFRKIPVDLKEEYIIEKNQLMSKVSITFISESRTMTILASEII